MVQPGSISQTMDALEKTWHARRAAVLSAVPGLGHLYIGEKRGYWVLLVTVSVLGLWQVNGLVAAILYGVLVGVAAWDTFLTVKRDRGLF
ncbi:MAG: hypothetical protein ACREIM_06320 [Nitrospiraceae bacterium]